MAALTETTKNPEEDTGVFLIRLIKENAEESAHTRGLLSDQTHAIQACTKALEAVCTGQNDMAKSQAVMVLHQEATTKILADMNERKITALLIEKTLDPAALKWLAMIAIAVVVAVGGITFSGWGFSASSGSVTIDIPDKIEEEGAP